MGTSITCPGIAASESLRTWEQSRPTAPRCAAGFAPEAPAARLPPGSSSEELRLGRRCFRNIAVCCNSNTSSLLSTALAMFCPRGAAWWLLHISSMHGGVALSDALRHQWSGQHDWPPTRSLIEKQLGTSGHRTCLSLGLLWLLWLFQTRRSTMRLCQRHRSMSCAMCGRTPGSQTPGVPATPEPSTTKNSSSSRALQKVR